MEHSKILVALMVVIFIIGFIIGQFMVSCEFEISGDEVGQVLQGLCMQNGYAPSVEAVQASSDGFIVRCVRWNINISNVSVG